MVVSVHLRVSRYMYVCACEAVFVPACFTRCNKC